MEDIEDGKLSPEPVFQPKSKKYQNTQDYYSLFISIVRNTGIKPYVLNNENLKLRVIRSGRPYNHFLCNVIFSCTQLFISCSILFRNHWTEYKYDTLDGKGYLLQMSWICGVSFTVLPLLNTLVNMDGEAALLSDWLKLEAKLDDILPEEPQSKSKRLRFLKIQYMFYYSQSIVALFGMIVMVTGNQRLPCFINSVWLPDPNMTSANNETIAIAANGAVKSMLETKLGISMNVFTYFFDFYDYLPPFCAWLALTPFDVTMSMIFRTMSNALDRLANTIENDTWDLIQVETIYGSLRIMLNDIHSIYGKVVFVNEMTNLTVNVIDLYSLLISTDVSLSLFFFQTSCGLLARMFLIYMPFVQVLEKSENFRAMFDRIDHGTAIAKLGPKNQKKIKQTQATMRYLVFRPLGFHRMTSTSMWDYVMALISYVLTCLTA